MKEEYSVGVADDVEDFREQLVDRIEDTLGIPAYPYASGAEALDALNTDSEFIPSVLVFDQIMPEVTGIEAFETIADTKNGYKRHMDARRMLLSGRVSRTGEGSELLNQAKDQGVIHDFHQKNKDEIEDLVRVVGTHHRTFTNLQETKQRDHKIKQSILVNGGTELPAEIYLPRGLETAKGIITFTHGLGYMPAFYKFQWAEVAAHDYLVVIKGMRGHRKQKDVFTIEAAIDDHNDLIRRVQEEFDFPNKKHVYCIGHSTGGLIDQIATLRNPHIRATTWVSPLVDLEQSYRHMFESDHIKQVVEQYKKKGEYTPGLAKIMENQEGVQLLREGKISMEELNHPSHYGTMEIANTGQFFNDVIGFPNSIHDYGVRTPIFIVRGASDEIIPAAEANRLYDSVKLPEELKQLYQTASTDHFQTGQWLGIVRRAVEFFNSVDLYKAAGPSDHLDRASGF